MTLQAYRLRLKFLRSEKSGPLFDTMALRIDAIASPTGMAGVFRLIAADVFEVLSAEIVSGFLAESHPDVAVPGVSLEGARTEMRGLQWISERINRATDLDSLLDVVLLALEEYFQFSHTAVLLYDETSRPADDDGQPRLRRERRRRRSGARRGADWDRRARTAASAPHQLRERPPVWPGDSARGRRRGPHARTRFHSPAFPTRRACSAIPLAVGNRLLGVIAAEDRDPMRFSEWHEAYLEIIANQIALGIDRMLDSGDTPDPAEAAAAGRAFAEAGGRAGMRRARQAPADLLSQRRRIFVDDEYLIRNIPARIFWKVLGESQRTGRTEFSNREMRVDSSLGLPPVKDNLESRLILLRRRLAGEMPRPADRVDRARPVCAPRRSGDRAARALNRAKRRRFTTGR